MDRATQRRLNAINREFYRRIAGDFDATRQRAWPGWARLLDCIDRPIDSVLDLGCGNGRFARFLAQNLARGFRYCGVDSSAALLAAAREQMAPHPQAAAVWLERDLVLESLPAQKADLVALFGLLHHVPGRAQRRRLLASAADCVAPGGTLVMAAWRFYDQERFRARIVPWPDDFLVEKHDYLLDWRRGKRAQRYCHYINDAEHEELIEATGLTLLADYRADGAGGDLNRYSILRRRAERD